MTTSPSSHEELYNLWMQRIGHGLVFREEHGCSKDWKLAYEFYRCQYPADIDHENMVFAVGSQMQGLVAPANPQIVITAVQPGKQAAAKVLQQVINQLFQYMKVAQELYDGALDAYLYGVMNLKLGYDSVYGYDPRQETVLGGTLSQFGKKGQRIEFFPTAASGMPWVMRVRPHDFVVPWGTIKVDQAPWVATRYTRYLEDVKADDKYDVRARNRLKASTMGDDLIWKKYMQREYGMTTTSGVHRPEPGRDDVCFLWEISDRRNEEVIVIAEDNEGIILRKEKSRILQVLRAHPFVVGHANANGTSFWSDSDFVHIKQPQESLNNYKTQINEHARTLVVHLLVDPELIEEDDLVKLQEGIPNSVLRKKHNVTTADLRNAAQVLTTVFPADLLAVAETERKVIREMMGFSARNLGEDTGPPRKTAREVMEVQQAHVNRIQRRYRMMQEVLTDLAKKISKLVFALWEQPQVIHVVGPRGIPYWVEFTGNELAAEYNYEFEAEDKKQADTEQRRSEALALMQQLPLLQQAGVDPSYIVSVVLKYFPEFDPDLALRSQQPEGSIGLDQFQGIIAGGEGTM